VTRARKAGAWHLRSHYVTLREPELVAGVLLEFLAAAVLEE
jgi:hypothetical protein